MDEKYKTKLKLKPSKSTKMTIIVYLCLLLLLLFLVPFLPPSHFLFSISLFPKYPKNWPLWDAA